MSFRTVVVNSQCKLSFKNNYLVVRGLDVKSIHIDEIDTLVIESTQVSITSYLLSSLIEAKIKIIFCDEFHMPVSELVPYYGCHNTSKKVISQAKWNEDTTKYIWTALVRQKVYNQALLLKKLDIEQYQKLIGYAEEIEFFDSTNREGHAAKVYFTALFGKDFKRDEKNNISTALNYGYSILLSTFTKEISKNGYITQLGLFHKNEFNYYNLSCDFMEPFRIIVDEFVYLNQDKDFDATYKHQLIDLLNKLIIFNGKEYYLINAVSLYVKNIFNAIESDNSTDLCLYEFL